MTTEVRSIRGELRVKKADDGTRTVSGLIPYNSLSVDLGGYNELLAPGCFATALEPGSDALALRDHDSKLLLGRQKSGTLKLEDSPEGLRYTLSLPDTTAGNDLAVSIDRGDLDSTSFGFYGADSDWAATDDGDTVRTIKSATLVEVSPCSWPAYEESSVTVRSAIPQHILDIHAKRNAPSADAAAADAVAQNELETLQARLALSQRRK